jgi:tRNA pseudouridine55 synthase
VGFFLNKIGHTGTLDPNAEGLLIILINKTTKQCNHFLSLDKEYIAKFQLGIETETWDTEGKVIREASLKGINEKMLVNAIESLEGDFNQIPPIFSAKKINGRPAYDYARKKEKITLEAKIVKIYNMDLISFDGENAEIKINCSSGTYVRSVVNIIGKILGCGATLISLTRTRIGSYDISESITLDELERNASSENFFKLFKKSIQSMDGFLGNKI